MYMRASLENFSNLPSKTAISYQQNSEKHVGVGAGLRSVWLYASVKRTSLREARSPSRPGFKLQGPL